MSLFNNILYCPDCGKQHLDRRWWAHRPHITHTCAFCRYKWDTDKPTIGVKYNEEKNNDVN